MLTMGLLILISYTVHVLKLLFHWKLVYTLKLAQKIREEHTSHYNDKH